MGGDNLKYFHKWKNYEQILNNYKVYVYKRPSSETNNNINSKNIIILDVPLIEISSTQIREKIKNSESIKYLVRDEVMDYIHDMKYYK